jgi:putative ABC transport system permease protein
MSMNALDRKLLRDLYRNAGLLVAIAGIIAVGIMCFVAMRSAWHNLTVAKRDYYARSRMADFWIDVKKAPLSELRTVGELPGVVEIHPRIVFSATVDLEGVDAPINSLVISLPDSKAPTIGRGDSPALVAPSRVQGADADRRSTLTTGQGFAGQGFAGGGVERSRVLNDIVLRQGGYFTGRRKNEVIVNDAFAHRHRLYPGQWIHLLLNNRRQELLIVGTAISSEFTYLLGPGSIVPDPERFGVFYLPHTFAEEVFDFQGAANQLVGRVAPGANIDDILRRAESRLEPYGVFETTPLRLQASNQFLSGEIDGLGAVATVVPTIFLAVAALVLNVLITRLARQQRTVIGTLKAIGYSDAQIFAHFIKFGMVVGIVGGILGCILGYLAATGMTLVYRYFFEFPRLDSGFYWQTHATGIAVSILCALVGSLYGAWNMLQLQPAAAMRPEPPKTGRAILLERISWFWNNLTSGWRMTLRSIARNRLRSAAAVFAAAMGTALLVFGFMMIEGQNYFLDFSFHRTSRSDIDLTFTDEQSRAGLDEVRRLPGVDWAEPQLAVACTFIHGPYRRKSAITGLPTDARLTTPRNAAGNAIPIPDSGLVLTVRLAELLHAEVGDQLTAIPVKGERRPIELTVAAIADSYLGAAAYANIDYLSRAVGEEFAVSGVQVATDGDERQLVRLQRQLKQMPGIRAISLRREMVQMIEDTLLQNQLVMIVLLIGFSGTMFFGSIVNASLVNLAERQREVATFRALGYGPWRIGGLFFRESLVTNAVGTLAGLPVGWLLVWLTANSYDNEMLRLPVVSAPWVWMLTWLFSFLFLLAAHLVVQWNIHRMDFVEALKVKE